MIRWKNWTIPSTSRIPESSTLSSSNVLIPYFLTCQLYPWVYSGEDVDPTTYTPVWVTSHVGTHRMRSLEQYGTVFVSVVDGCTTCVGYVVYPTRGEGACVTSVVSLNVFSLLWIDEVRASSKERPINECQCDERLKTKDEESTRLVYSLLRKSQVKVFVYYESIKRELKR